MIEIWYLSVARTPARRLREHVTEAEREQAARFRRPQDAARFLGARALTRAALAPRLGAGPLELEFSRACEHCGHPSHGRPRLATAGVRSGAPTGVLAAPEFSVTRAGETVAVAVGAHPLGLDAEPRRAGVERLLRSAMFSDEDRAMLASAAPAALAARTLELWVRKEAVGKASGFGVVDAGGIRLPPPAATGWGPAADALGRPCWVSPIELLGTVAAALATMAGPESVQVSDAGQLGL